jgi:hypothetical protein
VVAVTMVGTPRAARTAVLAVLVTYPAIVLLETLRVIPLAPLVRPALRHAEVAGGPTLPILSVATAVLGSYAFVLLARRRLERQAATERRLRLERQAAEAQSLALQHQLEVSQRMESLGRLAGGVAHDFNNVLTALISNLALAQEDLGPAEHAAAGVAESLTEARACADRASAVVRQLLAFSHRHVGEAAVVRPGEVVAAARRLLRRVIREDIAIEVDEQPGVPSVLIDPTRLEQVLLNLAVNARDAIAGPGRIALYVRPETLGPADAGAWPGLAPGEYARLEITDDGVGMDEATRARAFEPFFTTKPHGQGTGLGLSIVFSVVHQCGGGVQLVSTPGRGTTVTLLFPATRAVAASAAAPVARPAAGTGTILLVEDQEAVRRAMQRLLAKHGYRVLVAASGDEALGIAAAEAAAPGGAPAAGIDLLLTDVIMPGMSGPELARRLLDRHPRLQVLLMSGYTEDELDPAALGDPRLQFLAKPFEPAELLARLAAAMTLTAGRRA